MCINFRYVLLHFLNKKREEHHYILSLYYRVYLLILPEGKTSIFTYSNNHCLTRVRLFQSGFRVKPSSKFFLTSSNHSEEAIIICCAIST